MPEHINVFAILHPNLGIEFAEVWRSVNGQQWRRH